MRVGPAVVAGLSFPGESGHGGDSVRCRGHGGQQTDEHRDDLCTRFGRVGGRSLLAPTLPVRGEGELRRVHREKAAPRIDWGFLIADMESRLAQLKERRQSVEAEAWPDQTELRDRLLEVNRGLAGIISEI